MKATVDGFLVGWLLNWLSYVTGIHEKECEKSFRKANLLSFGHLGKNQFKQFETPAMTPHHLIPKIIFIRLVWGSRSGELIRPREMALDSASNTKIECQYLIIRNEGVLNSKPKRGTKQEKVAGRRWKGLVG